MYKIVQVHPDLRLTKPENPAWKHELKYCANTEFNIVQQL